MNNSINPSDSDIPPAKRSRSDTSSSNEQTMLDATTKEAMKKAPTGVDLAKIVQEALLQTIPDDDPSVFRLRAELLQGVASRHEVVFSLLEPLTVLLDNPPEPDKKPSAASAGVFLEPLKAVLKAHHTLFSGEENAKEVYSLLHKAAAWLLQVDDSYVGQNGTVDFELLSQASHSVELTQMLLDHGANPNPKSEHQRMLIEWVADVSGGSRSHNDVLKLLAPHYCPKTELGPALLRTCKENYCCNGSMIQTLVQDCDADVNYRDPNNGETPLLLAAGHRYEGCVRVLLEAGAKPIPDHQGKTPLMEAAYAYHENGLEVELLIEAGDNVNTRDREGRTALQYAFENDSISDGALVRALIARGAHGNSMPGCGLLKNVFRRLEGDDEFEDDEEEEIASHRMHIFLLRATLPVMPLDGEEYNRLQECEEEVNHNLASTCLAVHQAHFRYARAVFVAARSCIQLARAYFSGVDSPIALALVAAYSAEERAGARANPMTDIHRPRRDVRFEHVQNETALREHSAAQGCEPFLNIQEAAERVARFAFDLNNTTMLPENERNECGLNMLMWYTYLDIPLSVGVTGS